MAEESTESKLDRLKALLGISDAGEDAHVEFAFQSAEEIVKNYCNIESIPVGLSNTVLRMAMDIYRNEQIGDDTVPVAIASISEGDTSTSYRAAESAGYSESVLKSYTKQLKRYRKVRF